MLTVAGVKPKPCQRCNGTGTEPDQKETGKRLRARRMDGGKSLREVARAAGFSAPYLSDLERGNRGWSGDTIRRVEEAIGDAR